MPTTKKDKNARVFVKATSWRFFATCDTIFLSWLFTGHIEAAFKIGLTEVITKIGLFYLHERIWERSRFGLQYTKNEDGEIIVTEKHYRSVVKGASWRFFGTLDTIIIALFWTGDYTKALAIGATEVVTKIALFWLHERIWLKIKWGRVDRQITISPKEPAAQSSQQLATVNVSVK
ncbi:DUF2061 domain-containing protein [Danxiaibacter flavus]|uniref:DUF2061 domain-containing protein n=1 Tax=Danxiaibacter flavus TaxID=3049108 RepID=A0ABV3ZCE6_9BACT|nr:DUF2061 domain-containing protein [Chitinophagaceae bacterium DXS]